MPSFASDPFVYLRQRAIRGGGSGGAVVAPVLGPLTLTPNTASLNSPYSGTVIGKTAGSTLSLSGPGAAGMSVVGATVSGTPSSEGSVNVIETLAGSSNSPRTSTGVLTVSAGGQTQLQRESNGTVTVLSLAPTYTPSLARQPDGTVTVSG